MKQLISISPVFTPGSTGVGTLDFSSLPNFDISKLYAVINVTRSTPIFVPGTSNYGISSVINSVITLSFDTSTHSTSDILGVYYDTDPGNSSVFNNNVAMEAGGNLQKMYEDQRQILNELRVMNYVLATGLNIKQDDVDSLRNDLIQVNNINN